MISFSFLSLLTKFEYLNLFLKLLCSGWTKFTRCCKTCLSQATKKQLSSNFQKWLKRQVYEPSVLLKVLTIAWARTLKPSETKDQFFWSTYEQSQISPSLDYEEPLQPLALLFAVPSSLHHFFPGNPQWSELQGSVISIVATLNSW